MRKTNGSRPPVVLRKMAWVEERLSCTRGLVDNLIADGKLEVVRFGRAKRITERSVLRLVDEQLKQLNDNGGKNHAGVRAGQRVGRISDLGPRVREVREHRDLTRIKLAMEVGKSSAMIKNIESSRNDPSLKTFYRIAEALQVPPEILMKPVGSPIPK